MQRSLALLWFSVLAACSVDAFINHARRKGTPSSCVRKKTELNLGVLETGAVLVVLPLVVFGLFNLPENNIDLTDRGKALSAQKKREERRRDPTYVPKDKAGLDPYRYKVYVDIDSSA